MENRIENIILSILLTIGVALIVIEAIKSIL